MLMCFHATITNQEPAVNLSPVFQLKLPQIPMGEKAKTITYNKINK